jgi:hypothetical protein
MCSTKVHNSYIDNEDFAFIVKELRPQLEMVERELMASNSHKDFVTTSERSDFWRTYYPSYLNGEKSLRVTSSLPKRP